MTLGVGGYRRASFADRGACKHRRRIVAGDASLTQRLARQIEPAYGRVLVKIAQDIRHLQRTPEMMREREPCLPLHAEHAHAEAADRAGDAVAVEIEGGEIGRADVGNDVHLHAVDDGEEILALQVESAHGLRQPAQVLWRRAGIERGDVGAPLL